MPAELIQVLGQRPACTGSGMYLQSIYRQAHRREYDQAVVAAAQNGSAEEDCTDFREDYWPVKFLGGHLDFPIFGMSDNMPYQSRRYSSMTKNEEKKLLTSYLEQIERAVSEFEDPTILAHHLWLVTAASAEKFTGLKVIGISHGTGLRQLQKNPRFADRIKRGTERLDKIFALNKYQKHQIVDMLEVDENKIAVTGLGYNQYNFYFPDREDISSLKEDDEIEIVYVGKLSRSKGVISLLRALERALTSTENKNVKLTLIGSGQGKEKELICQLAESANFSVELTGLLPQQEVGERLRQASIFCLPSFYEGFALVILEALACGLRVVTSDIPGVSDYLPEVIQEKSALQKVKLPPMKDVDIPSEKGIKDFEKRLARALQAQITESEDFSFLADEDYREAVRSLGWEGVFRRLEDYF